jgi:PhnB protein
MSADLEGTFLLMATPAEPVSAVRQTATPRLRIKHAAVAIEFYKKAFGAREIMRFVGHGEIGHAEIAIGNSIIMLGEEALEYGFPGPLTLGGSPVSLHLYVDDADALVTQAVAAGARLVTPVKDQFYGDRSGEVADPFGYSWVIATHKEDLSLDEMHRRFDALNGDGQSAKRTAAGFVPKGFHAVTPYLLVKDAPGLIDFVKQVFGAEETFRTSASVDGMHAEVRLGDSRVMIGGGSPEAALRGEARPTALHVYVLDTDAAYQRAMKAGAVSIHAPTDHDYGERGASVKDPFGNHWYIATHNGERYTPEGIRTVTPYLQPLRSEPVISFLKHAFGAEEVARHASPDGVVFHARIRIGDSSIEMADAHGLYQPMPTTFYLYLPNVDAAYRRALEAGATSTAEPVDQPYGDRNAGVKDVFGNQWHMAMRIRDLS